MKRGPCGQGVLYRRVRTVAEGHAASRWMTAAFALVIAAGSMAPAQRLSQEEKIESWDKCGPKQHRRKAFQ